MNKRHFKALIVGGGHAGAQTAIALRQASFDGSIGIVGDEPILPYERPPLSKDYLQGLMPFEQIMIRSAEFWKSQNVAMLLGNRVVSIEPASRLIMTDGRETIGYDKLIWATGGTPCHLPSLRSDLRGVHYIRACADVDRLMSELPTARKIAVIGGGFIGLEAAAVFRKIGKEVVLLEALDRVLARVSGEPISRFFEAAHRAHGVDLRFGVRINGLEGDDALRVTGVRLSNGELVEADIVVVGIGILPAVGPLLAAGAEGGKGVRVDAQCRTSLPDVFAVGDCALHANRFADGQVIRLESVQNAHDQATVAAKVIAGRDVKYDCLPWFWSNQYDLKLQTVGISAGFDDLIVEGDPSEASFSVAYTKAGRIIAVDCVNAPRDYVKAHKVVRGNFS
ncbi:MAG: FAD-dependent oxidoreductase [Bradyrhizobium sp.]|uniref:NAD(P)/FAD-dependent oxidoreductase n=1 Tax=Bradyrhizobium sp. TaxID=376 RepID=UPI000B582DE8|nr:FAD-dependent oxidoreductase [Bradyrhizobium sp.]ART39428.1 J500 [uncultured bacterium]MDX3969228.1 FAD-dependent oxidoreductase [Bradyrhizobium sp.]